MYRLKCKYQNGQEPFMRIMGKKLVLSKLYTLMESQRNLSAMHSDLVEPINTIHSVCFPKGDSPTGSIEQWGKHKRSLYDGYVK